MNVLLYAPPLLLLMLKVHMMSTVEYVAFIVSWKSHHNAHVASSSLHLQAMDISGVLLALAGAALVQVSHVSVSFIYL